MEISRFDLEQQILECWRITDDIKMLAEAIGNKEMSEDKLMNILIGMQDLYDLKFDKTFNTFCQLIADRKV